MDLRAEKCGWEQANNVQWGTFERRNGRRKLPWQSLTSNWGWNVYEASQNVEGNFIDSVERFYFASVKCSSDGTSIILCCLCSHGFLSKRSYKETFSRNKIGVAIFYFDFYSSYSQFGWGSKWIKCVISVCFNSKRKRS